MARGVERRPDNTDKEEGKWGQDRRLQRSLGNAIAVQNIRIDIERET